MHQHYKACLGMFSYVVLQMSACGGIDDAHSLFGANGSQGGAGDITTSDSTSSSTTTETTSSTGTTTSSSSSTSSTSSSTTTNTTTSSSTVSQTLDCGEQSCPLDSICCWDNYKQYGEPYAECLGEEDKHDCKNDVSEGGIETQIECQLPSQCEGQVCCARRRSINDYYSYYDKVTCETKCTWPDVLLCDPSMPDACPIISTDEGSVQSYCQQSELLPIGYYVCAIP